jgi:hypothetical protein
MLGAFSYLSLALFKWVDRDHRHCCLIVIF